ncbi:MAG: CNNM domain-containing protein [Patescibacteria group bacterium]
MRGENTPIEHPQGEETGKIPQTPEELLEQTQALLSDFQRKSEEVVEEAGADQSVDVKKPLASPAPTSRRSFLKGLGVGVGFAVVGTSARVAREGSYEKPQDAREGSALPSLEEILEDPSCAEQLSTDQMDTLAVLLDSAREKKALEDILQRPLEPNEYLAAPSAESKKMEVIEMIAGTTALMTLSGFLTATEKAFGSADISELRLQKDRGDEKAKRALDLIDNIAESSSTLTALSTLVNVGGGMFVGGKIDRVFGSKWVSSLAVPYLMMVFAEDIPKKIGRIKADQIAKATSRTLSAFNSLMKPLTLSMKGVSTLVERGFDLKQTEEQVSIDHLLYDLSDAAEHGTLKPELSQMCRGILTMMRATAREIATRTIFSFTSETPVKEVYAGIQKRGFSRIPIMQSDRVDQERTELPMGYVLSKQILALPPEDLEKTIGDLVREKPEILQQAKFFYTSERATVYDVYKHMLNDQAKMSFVIDRDSLEIRGIITFEDVLEFLAQREILDEDDIRSGNEREHEAEIQDRYKSLRTQFEQRASKIPLTHP